MSYQESELSEEKKYDNKQEKSLQLPKSDKMYYMGQKFRQFIDVKGFKFNSIGDLWQLQWIGKNSNFFNVQFCQIGTTNKFDKVASIDSPTKIPAGIVAILAGFDSVEKFEKHFKEID
jgi:hypothetical protein